MSCRIRDLVVEMLPPESLKPARRNARKHSRRQLRQVAKSIEEFGWTNPILVDASSRILAGHARHQVATEKGTEEVPTIRIDDLTEEQKRAYILADNKIAENAGWDTDLLKLELGELVQIENLDFDVTVTGFEMAEIDMLIFEGEPTTDDKADVLPSIDPEAPVVTQSGDLWILGDHRLVCGDATSAGAYSHLMVGEAAQIVFTDPPYNVNIDGHVSGLGKTRHSEFAMASGEMTSPEFTLFLRTCFENVADYSQDGSIHFICMDWRHSAELQAAVDDIYSELKNICVWAKTNAGMGSLYRSAYELVLVYKKGKAKHINNVELGRHGRNRTNVWSYSGMNSFGADRDQLLSAHPTVKPVALVQDAILDCSNRGGIVLDPFAGSGTTFIAAERVGRHCYGLEIEPKYVDLILRRYREATGNDPVHAASGESFRMREVGLAKGPPADFVDGQTTASSQTAAEDHHG
jgi:DNA modification methylase